MFYKIDGDKVSIRIKAQPAASKNEFCEIYGEDAIKIRIKAPAVEGAVHMGRVTTTTLVINLSKKRILVTIK